MFFVNDIVRVIKNPEDRSRGILDRTCKILVIEDTSDNPPAIMLKLQLDSSDIWWTNSDCVELETDPERINRCIS